MGMKSGTNVTQVNVHQMKELDFVSDFQDGGHDVISGRKVLPSGECTCSVHLAHMQQHPPVPDP